MKICLDAGHYGKYNRSPVVPEYYESVFNWKFTQYEAEELRRLGAEVVLTRSDLNKDEALVTRGKDSKGCIAFFSNHSNACSSEKIDHPSIIIPVNYKNTDINGNRALAALIGNNISQLLGTKEQPKIYSRPESYDRNKNGIAGDDEYYGVLHGAQAVNTPYRMIVEHGFHTNTATAKKLLDENVIKILAVSEAQIIAAYLGLTGERPERTYTVVKGDTLSKIGKKFGVKWLDIATLNNIKLPYVIHPGQSIKIP